MSGAKVLHLWRILIEPRGMGRLRGSGPRRWQVEYPDGGLSVPMAYDEACNYRGIFGGTVHRWRSAAESLKGRG